MFNSGFGALADDTIDLYPETLRTGIDALNDAIYPALNNGVYRAGFATTQIAYEEAFAAVFAMLDALEARLGDGRPYPVRRPADRSRHPRLRDARSLRRAYHGQFKCNLQARRRLSALKRLSRTADRAAGFRETVSASITSSAAIIRSRR